MVPVSVTATVVPRIPSLGETFASVGAPGAGRLTVKGCAPLVPPAVVTATMREPAAAVGPSTKMAAQRRPVLPTMMLLTVTPLPLTVTVVLPTTKLVPVSVTGTWLPWRP